jgi:hypothetical protein
MEPTTLPPVGIAIMASMLFASAVLFVRLVKLAIQGEMARVVPMADEDDDV